MDTIGKLNLDTEYLAAQFLKGIILPVDYVNLRNYICKLQVLDFSPAADVCYKKLLDFVTKIGILEDKEVEKFYQGDSLDLLSVSMQLLHLTEDYSKYFQETVAYKLQKLELELESRMSGQDFTGMGIAIDSVKSDNTEIQQDNEMSVKLRTSIGLLKDITALYGTGEKFKKKTLSTKLSSEYLIYLQNLLMNLDQYVQNAELSATLSKAIDTILTNNPKNQLDPYRISIEENLIHVLTHPKEFYHDCATAKIIDQGVGRAFHDCYPGFYEDFLGVYLDEYEDMPYQSQLNFLKCFGLSKDDSKLVQLCSSSMIATPQGAQ